MSALLAQHLRPFEKYFKRGDVVELCINQPGEIWLETFTGWEVKKDKELTLSNLNGFGNILATLSGQVYSDEVPMLSTSIPGYGFRTQIVSGAMVESKFAAAIRISRARRFGMDVYFPHGKAVGSGVKVEKKAVVVDCEKTQTTTVVPMDDMQKFVQAVLTGKNILVAGGTSSGKTTFMNSVIALIPEWTRLLTVEDSRELVSDHPNRLHLLKSKTGTDVAKVTYKDIINACMRLRPDRILLGELDVENTVPFLRLLNTGHGGSMGTIHADSPQEAFGAMVLNAQLAGLVGPVEEYARKAINVIAHMTRVDRSTYKLSCDYL